MAPPGCQCGPCRIRWTTKAALRGRTARRTTAKTPPGGGHARRRHAAAAAAHRDGAGDREGEAQPERASRMSRSSPRAPQRPSSYDFFGTGHLGVTRPAHSDPGGPVASPGRGPAVTLERPRPRRRARGRPGVRRAPSTGTPRPPAPSPSRGPAPSRGRSPVPPVDAGRTARAPGWVGRVFTDVAPKRRARPTPVLRPGPSKSATNRTGVPHSNRRATSSSPTTKLTCPLHPHCCELARRTVC